jgi:hypothetical protein
MADTLFWVNYASLKKNSFERVSFFRTDIYFLSLTESERAREKET